MVVWYFPIEIFLDDEGNVRKVMPSDGIIALDNGMYKIWFARNYKAHAPNTVLLDNALASMGAGLPSAMVASFVHADKPVMVATRELVCFLPGTPNSFIATST